MKNIIKYELYESGLPIWDKDQISFLDNYATNWSYNKETGLVDCDGFDCSDKNIDDFKGIKFGEVKGNFLCYINNLNSLDGSPNSVVGNFYCYHNNLTSLVGAPNSIGGDFSCYNNKLISLEGAPSIVGGDFSCDGNNLTSLVGAPSIVGGNFYCEGNKLTSLEALFKIDMKESYTKGMISSDFDKNTIVLIREQIKLGLDYKDALMRVWSELPDKDKKILINDLPDKNYGIKKANKYGLKV